MAGERLSKTEKLAWSNLERVLKRRVTYKQNTAWVGSAIVVNLKLAENSAWRSVIMPWNNTGKNGKNGKLHHLAHLPVAEKQAAGAVREEWLLETIPMRWSGRVVPRTERKSVTLIFCDPTCATKQGKIHDRVGIKMCESEGWLFQLPLDHCVLQRLCVPTQGTDPVAPVAISTTYQRGSLSVSTTRYFPVPTVRGTAFSLKGTLRLMSWTAPLPQVSHLEWQSEQQGQKALQEEHSREAKQIKDIFCAFKASPIKFCRFLTVTARKIHMAEKLSSSLAWQQTLPPKQILALTCLSPLYNLILLHNGSRLGYYYIKLCNFTALCKTC